MRTIPAHLQRVALPGGELRFCYLCCNDFWDWMSSRATHSESEPTVPTAKGLALGLCLVCGCELDRWLKPLYTPAAPISPKPSSEVMRGTAIPEGLSPTAATGKECVPKVPAQSPAATPKEAASPAKRMA